MEVKKYHAFIIYSSLLIIGISVAVMVCWVEGLTSLLSIIPDLGLMQFNTALGLFFSALALLFLDTPRGMPRIPHQIFSALTLFIGVLTLADYAFDISLGFDQLIYSDSLSPTSDLPLLGRMPAATATCFTFLGASMLLFSSSNQKLLIIGQYVLHFVTLLTAIALVGYLYNVSPHNKLSFLGSMAMLTSLCLFVLSIAATLKHPNLGIAESFGGQYMGNWLARKVFLRFILIILVLGYLRLLTHRFGLISEEFGISLLVIPFLIASLLIILRISHDLNQVDSKRQRAELNLFTLNQTLEEKIYERTKELDSLNQRLQLATSGGNIGLWTIDIKDNFLDVNAELRKI